MSFSNCKLKIAIKKLSFLMAFVLVFCAVAGISPLPSHAAELVIVLDPGHGGDDVGAVYKNNSRFEKDDNLALALLVAEKLKEKDIDVGYKEFTHLDASVAKGAFFKEMEKQLVNVSNTVNAMSNLYFIIHYNVLIDMGCDNEFLKKHNIKFYSERENYISEDLIFLV